MRPRSYTRRLHAICAVGVLSLVTAPAVRSVPQGLVQLEQRSVFRIPAGSLESALLQFSRDTEIQVIVSARVADVRVGSVEGRLSAKEALDVLLKTTGLVYTVVGKTITIHPPEN
jgi:hypothetical protein